MDVMVYLLTVNLLFMIVLFFLLIVLLFRPSKPPKSGIRIQNEMEKIKREIDSSDEEI